MSSAALSSSSRSRFEPRRIELGKLFEKLPPHAVEAEAALLGSMILDWRVCGEVLQILSGAEDFYQAAHCAIYETLIELYDQHQSIDAVQLHQRLKDKQQIEHVGGPSYLVELAESVPSAASAGYYARIVRDKALLRRLIEAAGTVLDDCYNSSEEADTVMDRAEQAVFRLAETRTTGEAVALGALAQEVYTRLENEDGRAVSGLETGFYELDEMCNGLQKGEMIIVAARPSMGKSAFALNIAEHLAVVRKQPVAVFSLEMGKEQLAQRLLCSRSGVDAHKLRRNMLSGEDFGELAKSVGELSDAPLLIDDQPGLSLLELRAKARRLAVRHDIAAVLIDYLQLMNAPGSESRQQEVSEISRGIKALARELNVPVVCLSQLNRQSESREGHRPRMSDLRESGAIEQDADAVLMLHRESYYHRGDPDWEEANPDKANDAEVILAKQRNGPTGTVRLIFDGNTTRFRNAELQQDDGY